MTTKHQLFSQLCESLIAEASTAMQMFSGLGAQEVLKQVHKNYSLGHDVDFSPLGKKPSWTNLKQAKGQWLFIKGTKGFAAATSTATKYPSYIVIAGTNEVDPNDGSVVHTRKEISSVAGAVDYAKSYIGDIVEYHYSDSRYSTRISNARKPSDNKNQNPTIDYLIQRFRPLFSKLLVVAQADIRGAISTLLKTPGSHDRARRKVDFLSSLHRAASELESGKISDYLTILVKNAVAMTAMYYYPEESKKIVQAYGYGAGLRSYTTDNQEGIRLLLQDIANGDREKLSTVLAFMKRGLLA